MFGNKQHKPQNRIDSLIGAGTIVEGDLNFTGGLRIDGQVNGNIVAVQGKPSTLVLSEHAKVNGAVSATHLVINGTINGPVTANEYLELQAKATVAGDVHYKTLEIQLGAIVEGRMIHGTDTAQGKVVAFKLNSSE